MYNPSPTDEVPAMMMRTFSASNMTQAIEMARESMGDDAVILTSKSKKGGGVSVTFGLDRHDEELFDASEFTEQTAAYHHPFTPSEDTQHILSDAAENTAEHSPTADEATLREQPLLQALNGLFEHHTVPADLRNQLLATAATLNLPTAPSLTNIQKSLTLLFEASFSFAPLPVQAESTRLILLGAPGSGKTITAAKLAAKMVVDNQPVRVISTDTKRAGGIDQLQAFTKILGVSLDTASSRAELKSLLQSYNPADRIIIDSPGCNPYDFQELKELGEFAHIQDLEPLLVCAAGTDPHEATEIASVFSFLDIERVVITRTDCARHYGGLLSVAKAGDYAFSHTTSSARAMGDCQAMTPELLAHLFTQYQRERMAA